MVGGSLEANTRVLNYCDKTRRKLDLFLFWKNGQTNSRLPESSDTQL